MGFLDRIKESAKDISGIGLNADEQFARAYERGVLLQPPDYGAAANHFVTASEKYQKDGNPTMAGRAHANAALYDLINTRDSSSFSEVIEALDPLSEIERIGSQKEFMPTEPLVAELKSLGHEYAANDAADAASKVEAYRAAGEILIQLGPSALEFAERFDVPGPRDNAMLRAMYNMGLADFHQALSVVMKSPADAHNLMQKASGQFQQVRMGDREAKMGDWESKANNYVDQVQSKRHCWLCGREMQGHGIFFNYYPARIEEYHTHLVEDLQQDSEMLRDRDVVLCTVCGSVIEYQADDYAKKRTEELKEWASSILNNHEQRLNNLESSAHTHSN